MKQKNLQSIMNLAWRFVREENMTISNALKIAWKNAKLYLAMKDNIVNFKFRKVDGSIRSTSGTLSFEIIPATSMPSCTNPHKKNSNRQAYFDMDKKEWRSYKRENLIAIN